MSNEIIERVEARPLSRTLQLQLAARRLAFGLGRVAGGVAAAGRAVERGLVGMALLAVVAVSLTLWMLLLPVWLFLCVRATVTCGALNVISVFNHGAPVDPSRVTRIVRLWPAGVAAILGVLAGERGVSRIEPRDVHTLLIETGLAAGFFTVLLVTSELARHYASGVLWVLGATVGVR